VKSFYHGGSLYQRLYQGGGILTLSTPKAAAGFVGVQGKGIFSFTPLTVVCKGRKRYFTCPYKKNTGGNLVSLNNNREERRIFTMLLRRVGLSVIQNRGSGKRKQEKRPENLPKKRRAAGMVAAG